MKARYELPVIGDGVKNQSSNPEVTVNVDRPLALINEQIFNLQALTQKLKNAYNGKDVEWQDADTGKLNMKLTASSVILK